MPQIELTPDFIKGIIAVLVIGWIGWNAIQLIVKHYTTENDDASNEDIPD